MKKQTEIAMMDEYLQESKKTGGYIRSGVKVTAQHSNVSLWRNKS